MAVRGYLWFIVMPKEVVWVTARRGGDFMWICEDPVFGTSVMIQLEIHGLRPKVVTKDDGVLVHYQSRTNVTIVIF